MTLVRFRPFGAAVEPFKELNDMRSEMNRLFDGFFGRPIPTPVVERVWSPAVDMFETKDEVVIVAEIPGVDQKDIHLSINGDLLVLRGERRWSQETPEDAYYRVERWAGKFERAVPLPVPIQADKVRAGYRDGVLTVSLPKAEEIKTREIKVEVA